MLKSIQIENVALIDKISIDFSSKFNVLSGETGAGKSIIIDALNFVIGGKTSKNLIKQNCSYMKVNAVFSCPNFEEVKEILESFDGYDENEIVILRKMQLDGRVDTKINGVSVSANVLKKLTSHLIDIHGQHEHQKLLDEKNHLPIIDGFIKDKNLKVIYQNKFQNLKDINEDIKKLNGSSENQERMLDLYNYQISEIENAKIQPNEDEILAQKKTLMQNAGKIFDSLNSSLECLDGSNSVVDGIKKSANFLSNIVKFDNSLENLVDRLNSCKFEALDIVSTIKEKLSESDFSKTNFDEIDERLDKIKTIKKKYGPSLGDVFNFLEKTKKEYEFVLNSKEKLKELLNEKEKLLKEILVCSQNLSKERQRVSKEFEEKVKKQLVDLGMKNARFVVSFMPISEDEIEKSLTESGADNVKFMFSANLGQGLKPLSEIISGGEASRFMLALKNILADLDGTPAMVFDEIDTGISGEMGYVVACKMANIARTHQIMAISHLPQICAMADQNLNVCKYAKDNSTVVEVKVLNNQEVLNEISRLSGGVKDSIISIEHAKELKKRCEGYKKSL